MRRTHEKYTSGSYTSSCIIRSTVESNEILGLLDWLESKVSQYESINISAWIPEEGLYFVEVKDCREFSKVSNENSVMRSRCGFTIDLKRGCIFWVGYNQERPQFTNGGMSFARSSKWKSEIRMMFGHDFLGSKVNSYLNVYPIKN